ncbi:MAG: hypothetical protein IPH62_19540 [Ignavibacteriae bacterium]|nr:hypothetical protein [Ignavibacteriota bacterium]
MTLIVSLKELVHAKNVFVKLSQSSFDIKTAYKLSRLILVLNTEYSKFDEFRIKLVEKYGTLQDSKYIIKDENQEIFNSEFESLLSEEVEINTTKFKISDLEKHDCVLTPVDIFAIEKFIED